MKRTILWILFATFIVYFGCKQKDTEVRSMNFDKIKSPDKYDTVYVVDSNYLNITNKVRRKYGKCDYKGF
jgi:hypothetical protein